MTRTLGATFALLLALSAGARAADTQIVVVGDNPKAVHEKIVDAAAKVCAAARQHDPFGDFGSQEECIENSIRTARSLRVASR